MYGGRFSNSGLPQAVIDKLGEFDVTFFGGKT
jgi:hypothetical protein